MAFSIYVQGIPDNDAERSWKVDGVVWPTYVIEKDSRFRSITLNEAYMDYVAVFSIEEAIEMNQKYLNWDLPHWRAKNEELQRILEGNRKSTSLVLVRIYEWESGLSD
jgi:hypothetical protein